MKFKIGDEVVIVANPYEYGNIERDLNNRFIISSIEEQNVPFIYGLKNFNSAVSEEEIELAEIVNSGLYHVMKEEND